MVLKKMPTGCVSFWRESLQKEALPNWEHEEKSVSRIADTGSQKFAVKIVDSVTFVGRSKQFVDRGLFWLSASRFRQRIHWWRSIVQGGSAGERQLTSVSLALLSARRACPGGDSVPDLSRNDSVLSAMREDGSPRSDPDRWRPALQQLLWIR